MQYNFSSAKVKYHIAGKFGGDFKFGSLAVGVETAKLKSANIILAVPATLLAPPGAPFRKLYI